MGSPTLRCIGQNVLRAFLESHGSEVVNMLTAEWKLEDALEVRWEEGMEQKSFEVAKKLLLSGQDIPFIMDVTGLTEEAVAGLK